MEAVRQYENRALGKLVESSWFKTTCLILIGISAVLLGLETSPTMQAQYGQPLDVLEEGIIWFFALELVMRLGAYGKRWPAFFASGWNTFDFIVVALCFIPAVGALSAVARLARVLRALRVVSFLPNLQLLIEALLKSFSSMGYVGLLLSIVFYVYGVVGVTIFASADPERFGSLGASCMTLFQVLTLEGWVDVLAPQQAAYPVLAPLYFVSFILLGTMIVLNLFIGVIVNGMSEAQADLLLEKARKEGDEVRDTLREVENQVGRLRMLLDKRESDLAQARQLLKSAANDADPRRERLKAV